MQEQELQQGKAEAESQDMDGRRMNVWRSEITT